MWIRSTYVRIGDEPMLLAAGGEMGDHMHNFL